MTGNDIRDDILQYMANKTKGDKNRYFLKCNDKKYNIDDSNLFCIANNSYQAFLQFYNFLWNTYEIDLIEIGAIQMGSYSCYTELIKFIIKYYFENNKSVFSIVEDEEFSEFVVKQTVDPTDPEHQCKLDMQLDLRVIAEIAKHMLYLNPSKKEYYARVIVMLSKFHVLH